MFRIVMFVLFLSLSAEAQQYGWQVIASPRPGYQMHVIEFVDSLHGWCEAGGLIYRTTDGGYTWTGTTGQNVGNKAISMVDTLRGWSAGSHSGIAELLYTTNGGEHWVQKLSILDREFNGIGAQSSNQVVASGVTHIFAVPDTGKITRTTNAGLSWIEETHADSITYLGQVQFIDSIHGWMSASYVSQTGGPSGRGLLHTTDGGQNWESRVQC